MRNNCSVLKPLAVLRNQLLAYHNRLDSKIIEIVACYRHYLDNELALKRFVICPAVR